MAHPPVPPATSASTHPSAPPVTVKPQPSAEGQRPPLRELFGALTVFVLAAGLIHMLLKRRRRQQQRLGASVRGFRKGESLVDDEDDLLISQNYG